MTTATNVIGAFAIGLLTVTQSMAADTSYDLRNFDKISISEGLATVVELADNFTIRAEADSRKTLEDLDISVKGDTLVIKRVRKWSGLSFFQTRQKATVFVTLPELNEALASSGSTFTAHGIKVEEIGASASSGAVIHLPGLQAKLVLLDASSGASIKANGECGTLKADASSGAVIRADQLQCLDVSADASSGAALRVFASDVVSADASSGSIIKVNGRPESVSKNSSSGGSVRMD